MLVPDSQIAKRFTMKRTKSSYIIQEGIAWEEAEKLSKNL